MATKRIVSSDEISQLELLLGETVTFFCCRYIYSGRLESIDEFSVCLANAGIVYETGELNAEGWKDRQALPATWNISLASIESFGFMK